MAQSDNTALSIARKVNSENINKVSIKLLKKQISQHRELTFYPKNVRDAQKLELVWYFTYSVSSSQLTSRMGSARAWHGGTGGWSFFVH